MVDAPQLTVLQDLGPHKAGLGQADPPSFTGAGSVNGPGTRS